MNRTLRISAGVAGLVLAAAAVGAALSWNTWTVVASIARGPEGNTWVETREAKGFLIPSFTRPKMFAVSLTQHFVAIEPGIKELRAATMVRGPRPVTQDAMYSDVQWRGAALENPQKRVDFLRMRGLMPAQCFDDGGSWQFLEVELVRCGRRVAQIASTEACVTPPSIQFDDEALLFVTGASSFVQRTSSGFQLFESCRLGKHFDIPSLNDEAIIRGLYVTRVGDQQKLDVLAVDDTGQFIVMSSDGDLRRFHAPCDTGAPLDLIAFSPERNSISCSESANSERTDESWLEFNYERGQVRKVLASSLHSD